MRRFHTVGVAVAVALLGLSAGAATAAESIQSLVQKVDAKLYYPQKEGMRSLQADAQSSWIAERLQNIPEGKNVQVRFYWSEPAKQRFVIGGAPESLADQVRQAERGLAMWGEQLVPKTLALTLADYKCSLREDEKSFILDASTTAPSARFPAMSYTIDKKTLLPTRWHLETTNWTGDVDIKYDRQASGQFLPVEMKARPGQNDVTIRTAYKKVEKWTLAESLTFSFVSDDGTTRTNSLRLSNFKINQPLPADVFPADRR